MGWRQGTASYSCMSGHKSNSEGCIVLNVTQPEETPPCCPLWRQLYVTPHPAIHSHALPSFYRWCQWRHKIFWHLPKVTLWLTQRISGLLVALYLKKARLPQVLNQISVKSYDCIELFFTFDEQFSFREISRVEMEVKSCSVTRHHVLTRGWTTRMGGKQSNQEKTCLQNVSSSRSSSLAWDQYTTEDTMCRESWTWAAAAAHAKIGNVSKCQT